MAVENSPAEANSSQAEHAIVKIKGNKVNDAEISLNNLESISGAINQLSISSIELKENEQIHLQDMHQVVLGQRFNNEDNPLADTSSTMI